MEFKKVKLSNLLSIVFIALLVIPQTRTVIQTNLQKLIISISPSPKVMDLEDQVSMPPFDYRVSTLDGIAVNSPVGKGKVTFVNYWATWCPPCIAELPSLEKLYQEYGDKVTFLFITQEDPSVVQRFLDRKGFAIPAVRPLMRTPEALNERSIPTNYIIDKTGKIVLKDQGAANWNSPEVRSILDSLL